MKTLVTISFALNLDEDELVEFVRKIDQSLYESIKAQVEALGLRAGDIDKDELAEYIDWYGASFTPKRDMLEGIQ